MKINVCLFFPLAILAGVSLPASAASPVSGVNIDWVTVGNPGNAPNPATVILSGAVAYEYKIARNETTIGQYAEFLNAVAKSDPYRLYNSNMGSDSLIAGIARNGSAGAYSYSVIPGSANKPITYVSWFDAARFCNWLHNGQGAGSTETGAYTLSGAMFGIVQRNADAKFWIPTEDEWHKAAYYDPTKGGTGGYWLHATQSDALAGNTIGNANSANYNDGDYVGYPGMALTDVGAYGANSASFYGTNDQNGNVWEWTDAIMALWYRGVRGGSWSTTEYYLRSTYRTFGNEEGNNNSFGFRVASVPEPAAMVVTMMFGGLLLTRRKR